MSLTATARQPNLTFLDYLPAPWKYVRVLVSYGEDNTPTWLVKAGELPTIAAENPRAKISVSPAAFTDEQAADCVEEVTAIAIDIDLPDDYIRLEKIEITHNRFPGALIVVSNGFTLYYKIGPNQRWRDLVPFAVAIGREIARTTGFVFDAGTLIRQDGTPANHENHLFRYPGGWANRRGASPFELPPITQSSIEEDCAGLPITPYVQSLERKTKQIKVAGGSLEAQRHECSTLLGIRCRVLAEGGTVDDAVAVASAETGIDSKKIQALYARPGYEPMATVKRKTKRFKDDSDQGVVGVESSSRRYQKTKTWWANFGHSIQAVWDMGWGVDIAYRIVVEQRDYRWFLAKFKQEHGAAWPQVLRADLESLYERFGTRECLRPVSDACKTKVLEAIADGFVNAPQIGKQIAYSERQVKRALKALQAEKKIESKGRNKGKVWSLLSGHTVRIDKMEIEGEEYTSLVRFPVHAEVQQIKVGREGGGWRRPRGCPVSSKQKREAWRNEGNRLKKNDETRFEVRSYFFTSGTENWWLQHPEQFRKLKSRFFLEYTDYKNGMADSSPGFFEEYAEKEASVQRHTAAVKERKATARKAQPTVTKTMEPENNSTGQQIFKKSFLESIMLRLHEKPNSFPQCPTGANQLLEYPGRRP